MEPDYQQVVAAVDLDESASDILLRAKWVASLQQLPLHVLHVQPRPAFAMCHGAEHAQLGDYIVCASQLQQLQQLLAQVELPSTCLELRVGNPAATINSYLEQHPGSLLVMGSPPEGWLNSWLHSTGRSLLRQHEHDTLVVHRHH